MHRPPGQAALPRWHRRVVAALPLAIAACASAPEPRAIPAASAEAPAIAATITAPPATAAAFEAEIAAFEARDRQVAPDTGGIVFTGSSSIRLWPELERAFPQRVIARGFGGSTLPDVIHFAPRIVLPYRPRQVVLYAGDNDIQAGHSPAAVLANYEAFVRLVRAARPGTRVVYISIKPSPSRWALAEKMRAANDLIRDAITRDSLSAFVDVFTPMLGANGRPRPELYVADSLHMSPAGYALWRAQVSPHLR